MGGSARYRFYKKAKQDALSRGLDWESRKPFVDMQWETSTERMRDLKKHMTIDKFMKLSGEKQIELLDTINMMDIEDLPEYLQIGAGEEYGDMTQKLAYILNMNEKPQIMSHDDFIKYMEDHNIPKESLLTRTVDYESALENFLTSDETYIGGRIGNHVFGYGTYFGYSNGEGSREYGSYSLNAILSPNAKIFSREDYLKLPKEVQEYVNSIPTPRGYDNSASIIAMITGCDAIRTPDNSIVILNRSAIITDGIISEIEEHNKMWR